MQRRFWRCTSTGNELYPFMGSSYFRSNRLYETIDALQYKFGSVVVNWKRNGFTSGWCASPKKRLCFRSFMSRKGLHAKFKIVTLLLPGPRRNRRTWYQDLLISRLWQRRWWGICWDKPGIEGRIPVFPLSKSSANRNYYTLEKWRINTWLKRCSKSRNDPQKTFHMRVSCVRLSS